MKTIVSCSRGDITASCAANHKHQEARLLIQIRGSWLQVYESTELHFRPPQEHTCPCCLQSDQRNQTWTLRLVLGRLHLYIGFRSLSLVQIQTMPLHCSEVYSTPPSGPGEQSRTVFFTLDPRRATARTSSRQTDSSRDKQIAMK